MRIAPVNATTDCRVDHNDLEGTVVRWEKLLTEDVCPHQHIAKGAPPCGINVAVYTLMDSNCHSGWSECDKEEGNWLWFVGCDNRKNGLPVSVGIKVRSLEPSLLQLRPPHNKESLPADEYQLPIPLWLFPFYGKSENPFCEKSRLAVIRHSTYEFRRALVEVEIRITMDRASKGRTHHQKTMLAVAILPLKGKIQTNDDVFSKGQKKREEPTASLESIRNSEKLEGDVSMGNTQRILQRIDHLDGLLDIEYDKLCDYEKGYAMLGPGPTKTALKLQMQRESWPEIRKLETKLAELLVQLSQGDKIPEDEAKILVNEVNEQVEKIESCKKETWPEVVLTNLQEIQEKLKEPKKAATAKLRITLPIIPLLASYILELDIESTLVQTWWKVKELFKKSIHQRCE